jgi:NADH:ubiquinone oxidoreductase subunit H
MIIIEIIIVSLLSIAFITLGERKIMGYMQRRRGPNRVGIYGIMQPIADGIKIIIKESIIPKESHKLLYIIAPLVGIIIGLLVYNIIPIKNIISNNKEKNQILIILALLSLNVYSTLYSGWSSNSKYSKLGSLRAIIQLISYEVSMGLILFNIIILNKSLKFTDMIFYQIESINLYLLFPVFILWLITILAESNRPPFDLPEAESELIAGYIVEYGGIKFAFIYLAEYLYILFLSGLTSILFLGENLFSLATLLIIFFFIWIRATLPRLKFSTLLYLGWIEILPLSIAYLIFILFFLFTFYY